MAASIFHRQNGGKLIGGRRSNRRSKKKESAWSRRVNRRLEAQGLQLLKRTPSLMLTLQGDLRPFLVKTTTLMPLRKSMAILKIPISANLAKTTSKNGPRLMEKTKGKASQSSAFLTDFNHIRVLGTLILYILPAYGLDWIYWYGHFQPALGFETGHFSTHFPFFRLL